MTWETLAAVRSATNIEFTKALANVHHFLRLPSGRWCRTLGPPEGAEHVRGRVWRTRT